MLGPAAGVLCHGRSPQAAAFISLEKAAAIPASECAAQETREGTIAQAAERPRQSAGVCAQASLE